MFKNLIVARLGEHEPAECPAAAGLVTGILTIQTRPTRWLYGVAKQTESIKGEARYSNEKPTVHFAT